jgi:hypothetical protein
MALRSEFELQRELAEVRKRLANCRAAGGENDRALYGAQQALFWALGKNFQSPSEFDNSVRRLASKLLIEE